jgi:hypothetical protein
VKVARPDRLDEERQEVIGVVAADSGLLHHPGDHRPFRVGSGQNVLELWRRALRQPPRQRVHPETKRQRIRDPRRIVRAVEWPEDERQGIDLPQRPQRELGARGGVRL